MGAFPNFAIDIAPKRRRNIDGGRVVSTHQRCEAKSSARNRCGLDKGSRFRNQDGSLRWLAGRRLMIMTDACLPWLAAGALRAYLQPPNVFDFAAAPGLEGAIAP